MTFQRRLIPIAAFLTFAVLFILYTGFNIRDTWREIPQAVGLGEVVDEAEPTQPSGWTITVDEEGNVIPPKETNLAHFNPRPKYEPGLSKPADYNFSMMLVVPRTREEDVSWMDKEIPEMPRAVYVADDASAELHPPKNKGHEVMIYLTWIIDNYEDLPDVAVFMHAHRFAWHNDELLEQDAAQMLRRLNPNRVTREGYMNMRCHWDPGCPAWMHPGDIDFDRTKMEQAALAKAWSELFPLDKIPDVLAQPCCSQFALSRDRIQSIPLSRFVFYRDWLLRTPLSDYISGRIWEYIWQFVFTGQDVVCPEMNVCYCDGFGVCFGGFENFNHWFEMRYQVRRMEAELKDWKWKAKAIEDAKKAGRIAEDAEFNVPEIGKDKELEEKIAKMRSDMNVLREEALERGKDPKARAEECGREWHEGDGF